MIVKDDSLECMLGLLDDSDESSLCHKFSHQSTQVFEQFMKSGVDCSDYLDFSDVSMINFSS